MDLTFLTINIAGTQFDWHARRRKVLIEALLELSPDVIFMQEVNFEKKDHYHQGRDLAKTTGLTHLAFAPYGNLREFESPRLGGIGILSRFPFTEVEIRNLPAGHLDKYGARVALYAGIEVKERTLLLGTTHLSWRPEEESLRQEQMKVFLSYFKEKKERAVIGGDFNAPPEERVIQELSQDYADIYHRHHPQHPGVTWNQTENDLITSRWRGDARIDYLLCSKELETLSAEVVLRKKNETFPSDHYGVLVKVRV